MAAKAGVSKPNRGMSEIALWANKQKWRDNDKGVSALCANSQCGMADVSPRNFIFQYVDSSTTLRYQLGRSVFL
jgi:hypothetical protein